MKASQSDFPQLISPVHSASGGDWKLGVTPCEQHNNSRVAPCSVLCAVSETQALQYFTDSFPPLCDSSTPARNRTEEPLWSCSSGERSIYHLWECSLNPLLLQPWPQMGLTTTPVPTLPASSVISGKMRRRPRDQKVFI